MAISLGIYPTFSDKPIFQHISPQLFGFRSQEGHDPELRLFRPGSDLGTPGAAPPRARTGGADGDLSSDAQRNGTAQQQRPGKKMAEDD